MEEVFFVWIGLDLMRHTQDLRLAAIYVGKMRDKLRNIKDLRLLS